MKKITRALIAGAVALSLSVIAAPTFAGTTDSYTFSAKSYSGSRNRDYKVYVPANVSSPAPMVMALHGCMQDHNDVINNYGMKEAAEDYGFILVAPFITTYDGMRSENCWGFWFDQHTHQGKGEPEDLYQIGLEVESNYGIDANRRYVTGLSSGGAMTAILATTHNHYFAAAAPGSGIAYGETSSSVSMAQCNGSPTFESTVTTANDMERELSDDYAIPIMVMQSNNDCVVQQPAGRNIRDAHLRVHGGERASAGSCQYYYQNNYNCKHVKYTSDGTTSGIPIVETIFFDGSSTDHGHQWMAGENGNSTAQYNERVGPSYPDLVWDFFSRNARNGDGLTIAKPTITVLGDNPMYVELNDAFSDPGATAEDPVDGTLTVSAHCNVDTSTADQYACNYTATNSADKTAVATRTVNVFDPSAPAESCAAVMASPSAHIDNGRATKGGDYDLKAISTGDEKSIGYYFDTWSEVTLHEGQPGEWNTAQPAACGGESTTDPTFTCQDWYTTNSWHEYYGRAYYASGYYTEGGDDGLGSMSGTYNYVKETSAGHFEKGACN